MMQLQYQRPVVSKTSEDSLSTFVMAHHPGDFRKGDETLKPLLQQTDNLCSRQLQLTTVLVG